LLGWWNAALERARKAYQALQRLGPSAEDLVRDVGKGCGEEIA